VLQSFSGVYPQRVDGKGRLSIPVNLRRVLEAGDPEWTEGLSPVLQLVYGDHLDDHLRAYSMSSYSEMTSTINAFKPRTQEQIENKNYAVYTLLTQSIRLEVDKDGRIVVPKAQRDKIGLTEGDVVLTGAENHFQIWAADTFDAKVAARMRAFKASRPPNHDPMMDMYDAGDT
jgi:MraZ protein